MSKEVCFYAGADWLSPSVSQRAERVQLEFILMLDGSLKEDKTLPGDR